MTVKELLVMPSIVWGRHPQEAYDNPYEYGLQEQFLKEAAELLSQLQIKLDQFTMCYHRDECTLEKATWMLELDLIDALQESVSLLRERRHRIAFRLFRDTVETMDLLRVFHSSTPNAEKALNKWYVDYTIPHSQSRKYIEETSGSETANRRRDYYNQLSKFTHRSYRALLKSFSLGVNGMLVHDSHSMGVLTLPQTIASGLAILADLIIQASECLKLCGPLESEEVDAVWLVALDIHTVPRQFSPQKSLEDYE